MEIALINGIRTEPSKGLYGKCPVCNSEVIARCGDINIWHWAHVNGEDCDSWSEGETEWHNSWKKRWPEANREVIIGSHRADIQTNDGLIIELQHSSISQQTILDREIFYGNMIWVVDGEDFGQNFYTKPIFKNNKVTLNKYTWNWPHKSYSVARNIFIDFGGEDDEDDNRGLYYIQPSLNIKTGYCLKISHVGFETMSKDTLYEFKYAYNKIYNKFNCWRESKTEKQKVWRERKKEIYNNLEKYNKNKKVRLFLDEDLDKELSQLI